MSENTKNKVHHNIPKLKVMSPIDLFCVDNSPKPIIKQKILTFDKFETEYLEFFDEWQFGQKSWKVGDFLLSTNWLID